MNRIHIKKTAAALFIVCLLTWCQPAWAISIKQEMELADEVMKVIRNRFELIEDPLIVEYVNRVGKKILNQLPAQPFTFHFYIINEPVYNAFAIPAGHIFIHSGLLSAMDSEEELAGILAHEITHAARRHISNRIENSKKVNLATMAGMIVGIVLGVSSGDPSVAQTLTIGSAAAGQSVSLAYSRQDETEADQLGLKYLNAAGYSGRGLLSALKRIRGKQWFGTEQIPSYMMTHPAIEERIARLDTWMANPSPDEPTFSANAGEQAAFKKAHIRLKALYDPVETARPHFQEAVRQSPDDSMQLYGYGLVLARMGKRSEALEHLRKSLSGNAFDEDILSDIGRVYFLDGQLQKALGTLESAASLSQANAEGLLYLGRTRMELDRLPEAIDAFEKAISLYPGYRPVYQFLGEAYGRMGNMPEAHYFLGVYNYEKGEYRTARYHLTRAQKSIQDSQKLKVIEKALEEIESSPEAARS
jgi:beta-barrel assembly-enhancing protease